MTATITDSVPHTTTTLEDLGLPIIEMSEEEWNAWLAQIAQAMDAPALYMATQLENNPYLGLYNLTDLL